MSITSLYPMCLAIFFLVLEFFLIPLALYCMFQRPYNVSYNISYFCWAMLWYLFRNAYCCGITELFIWITYFWPQALNTMHFVHKFSTHLRSGVYWQVDDTKRRIWFMVSSILKFRSKRGLCFHPSHISREPTISQNMLNNSRDAPN